MCYNYNTCKKKHEDHCKCRCKKKIMIGIKKTTIMTIITNVKKIATKVVVRKDSVIAVTGITKRNDSAGKVEF